MSPRDAWLQRLFLRLDALPLWRSIPTLAAIGLAASLTLAVFVALPLHLAGIDSRPFSGQRLMARGLALAFILGVLLVPLIETWVLQVFPMFVARHFTGRPFPIVLFLAVSFALPHAIFSNVGHGIAMLGAGSVLAFTYFWASRRPPRPHPVLATYAVHALNNAVALGLSALFLRWTGAA